MRYLFAGGPADYVIATGDTVTISTPGGSAAGKVAVVVGGQAVTFWTAETGGTQLIDLLSDQGDPVESVTSSDGTGTRGLGQIPTLSGPPDVVEMWASAGGGPRVRMVAGTGALALDTARDFDQHAADHNGHATSAADLTDVTMPPPESRTPGDLLGVVAGGSLGLLTPAQASGAVLLDPPEVAGAYVGNVAAPPDPAQGQNGNPWLKLTQPWSATDDNPDALQFFSTSSTGQSIKTGWFNGNGELRAAPSLPNRIAGRIFEAYENRNGPSSGRFFELSTNPLNAANREALFGAYGTAHGSMPGWMVATRVLWAQRGVQAGGSFNALSSLCFRGRSASTGAPTSGVWTAGDVVIDAAGVVWLCTATGEPGTWVGSPGGGGSNEAGPTAFVDITPGTNMAHATKHAATRLERGGDSVRLRGALTATGAVTSGAVIATIPTAGHRPLSGVTTIARYTGGGNKFDVAANGDITYQAAFTAGQTIWLDGITWDLVA